MKLTTSQDGATAIIEPAGTIDTRSSIDFEKKVMELFGGGSRLFAIDFTKVDMITSAGIRVLMMLTRRLEGGSGGLALFGLNEQVQTVFEIAGLMSQFRMAPTRPEALAQLAQLGGVAPPPAAPKASQISRLAARLLGGQGRASVQGRRGKSGSESGSDLTARVAQLLKEPGSDRHRT
jgi:anti-anti-sigma factor